MNKIVLLVGGILVLLWVGRGLTDKIQVPNSNSLRQAQDKQMTNTISPTNYQLLTTISRGIFIPYWSSNLNEGDTNYDFYYYFGIAPTARGEIENDAGLSNMPKVVEGLKLKVQSQKKIVLRMLNASVTDVLLIENVAQKTLINTTNTILDQYYFSGIVLDIEVPFTLQEEKKGQITKFVQQICTGVKTNYKTCDVLVYGDYAYRGRPYDLRALSQAADKILLMAYDFHKAGGESGPNFSFNERVKYGYDYKQMVSDTIKLVPKEKIEVVFGMYGYDWTLNEQGKPLKSAQALSLFEIQALNSNSKVLHSNEAKEKSIHYVDSEGRSHVVWYEDEESAAVKTKFLFEHGISRVSFWAHSYF